MNLINDDCMNIMPDYADDYFDLAIVDPPYGIGGGSNSKKMNVDWDSKIPDKKYFDELIRVSKNQIIWGGNYMSKNIPFSSKHTLVWDKQNGDSFMSDGELAFTSFDKNTTKFFRLFWMSNMMKKKEKPIIHPTQKPIQLYRWLLENYAEPTDKILDTHLGSGSIAIACHYFGIKEFVGIEIDKEYFDMTSERIEKQTMQIKLL